MTFLKGFKPVLSNTRLLTVAASAIGFVSTWHMKNALMMETEILESQCPTRIRQIWLRTKQDVTSIRPHLASLAQFNICSKGFFKHSVYVQSDQYECSDNSSPCSIDNLESRPGQSAAPDPYLATDVSKKSKNKNPVDQNDTSDSKIHNLKCSTETRRSQSDGDSSLTLLVIEKWKEVEGALNTSKMESYRSILTDSEADGFQINGEFLFPVFTIFGDTAFPVIRGLYHTDTIEDVFSQLESQKINRNL